MGGLVSSPQRLEGQGNRILRRNDTAPSEASHSRRSSGNDSSGRWAARPSLKKARLSSQRRKELETFKNTFLKNFQNTNFQKYSNQFAEYLRKEWTSYLHANEKNDPSSPHTGRSSSQNPKLRRVLDHLIHDMMGKTSIIEEVYHTNFSGYDLDLKSNGHNKVVHLNHLKRRNSSILLIERDEQHLTNPYISIEILQDWLLLIFWSIFIVEYNQTITPPTSTKTSSVIQQPIIRSSGKVRPFEEDNNEVVPFDLPLSKEDSLKVKPIQEKEKEKEKNQRKKSSFNFILSTSQKLIRRFHSNNNNNNSNNSDKSTKEELPPIQSNDLREKHHLLHYSDVIARHCQKNEGGFINYVTSGDWYDPTTFFTTLEIVNVAISILSVDVNDTSSFPIIYVNSAWETMIGYCREDVLGKDITLLMGSETEESQSGRLGSCMKNGLRLKIGINLMKSDQQSYLYNLLTMIPVYDYQKNYKYIILKFYDINCLTTNLIDLKYSDEVLSIISLALRSF